MSEIECTFVRVLMSSSTSSSSSSKFCIEEGLLQPFQILALVDRRAMGLASWIHHLSPHQVVDLCQRQNLLSKVWERVFAMERSSSSEEGPQKGEDRGQPQREPAIDRLSRGYSLSVLTHLLMQLRVSLFPWYLIETERTTTTTAETARLQLLTRLLQEVLVHPPSSVSGQTPTSEEWKHELCYAGIETLLSGIRGDELVKAKKDMVAQLGSPHQQRVATESTIQRLEQILDRVDAFSSF